MSLARLRSSYCGKSLIILALRTRTLRTRMLTDGRDKQRIRLGIDAATPWSADNRYDMILRILVQPCPGVVGVVWSISGPHCDSTDYD